MSKGIFEYTYHPEKKIGTWDVEVDFEARNLTPEQTELATKIIHEKRDKEIYGFQRIADILNRLSKAGFRGEIVDRTQLFLPLLIVIKSKIDKDKRYGE
ncbi:MAG: hypothetical protein K2H46_07330 [Muribaculaceae bacterium]|nr:hypothetical protein [Muribaculaceae bacterium]